MNQIDLYAETDDSPIPVESIKEFLCILLDHLSICDTTLSLTLCSDEKIQQLNFEYRQKDEPTDILSFTTVGDERGAQAEEEEEPFLVAEELRESTPLDIGDLFLSLAAVERNCKEYRVEYKTEFKRLLIHGVLHLLGYRHRSYEVSEPMLLHQENLLNELKEEAF